MKKILFVFLGVVFLVGIIFLSSYYSSGNGEKNEKEKIQIMVSVLPQVEFVERIGGDKVNVSEMIPPGFSPATYDPSPEQLMKLQDADIYFRIGQIPFEKVQMERLAEINQEMIVIDTSKGVEWQELATHSHREEGHEDEHDDEHGDDEDDSEHEAGIDPHIWLSPSLVKIQAEHIYNALVAFSPENEDYFLDKYNSFIQDLEDLDVKLSEAFTPIAGETILVFHPSFGYLAHDYGFEQESIEIEGKDPSPEHLKKIIDEALEDNVRVIFVQKQFSTKSSEAVAQAITGTVIQIDPLAKDYFTNLEEMSYTIVNNIK
jgi:zinc transport system substrate-binding protein